MSSQSHIEWTDATRNPVTGCTKVSAGCKHCYAERISKRFGQDFSKIELHPERLDLPLHWRKPRMIFVNSMSDLFHEKVPFEFIDRVFAVMALCPQHTFQVLTKRPERMAQYVGHDDLSERIALSACAFGKSCYELSRQTFDFDQDEEGKIDHVEACMPLPNVWLGTSVEDQKTADERIPHLLSCPAAVRFLSVEPMLGPVNLKPFRPFIAHLGAAGVECEHGYDACPICDRGIDWVICGGESGPGARPMHLDWVRSVRDQCAAAGVPFFFKQWGEWVPTNEPLNCKTVEWQPHGNYSSRVGKKQAGAMLDGREHREWPTVEAHA